MGLGLGYIIMHKLELSFKKSYSRTPKLHRRSDRMHLIPHKDILKCLQDEGHGNLTM